MTAASDERYLHSTKAHEIQCQHKWNRSNKWKQFQQISKLRLTTGKFEYKRV